MALSNVTIPQTIMGNVDSKNTDKIELLKFSSTLLPFMQFQIVLNKVAQITVRHPSENLLVAAKYLH